MAGEEKRKKRGGEGIEGERRDRREAKQTGTGQTGWGPSFSNSWILPLLIDLKTLIPFL